MRVSILDLSGIQPVTGSMSSAAGGELQDRPSAGEIELFRQQCAEFQMISVVASLVAAGETRDGFAVTPSALSLMPASKRGHVQVNSIETVAALNGGEGLAESQLCYVGYDPFSGDWALFGQFGLLGTTGGFLDELGLIVGMYFLATKFDPDDVLMMMPTTATEDFARKYRRKRCDLLFRPFERVEARRIWGAESPIELFVIQELARHGVHPAIQMLIMDDGQVFPSWYHFWEDLLSDQVPGLITEADLFFSDEKVAVFCDGAHHRRLKQRKRDEAIDARLQEMGITSIRLPGRMILRDLEAAGRLVMDALRK